MAVDVNVDGIIITVTDTDDPVLAKRAATRYVKKQKGEYSSLGETSVSYTHLTLPTNREV